MQIQLQEPQLTIPPVDDLQFPTELHKAMLARGLNKSDLAKLTGLSSQIIGRYLAGITKPRPKSYLSVIRALESIEVSREATVYEKPKRQLSDYTLDELFDELRRRKIKSINLD